MQDNKKDRIVEVQLKENDLYCLFDEESECVHVGFAYSIPKVYQILNEKGVRKVK